MASDEIFNEIKSTEPVKNGDTGINRTLVDAWQVFADYDHNANIASSRFNKTRYNILVLAVIATAVAITYEQYLRELTTPLFDGGLLFGWSPSWQSLAKIIVITLPITVSMMLTWASKFERGLNRILLRGAAESIKREIFLFRAKAGFYNDSYNLVKTREVRLAEKIKSINERLMKTEVNKDGLQIYGGPLPPMYAAADGDDGFSYLAADNYIVYRLENQMDYYKGKVEKLGKVARQLNFRIIFFGALGTLLAALNFEIWVALTTAIVGAITSYLELNQYEDNVSSYNQTSRDLESLRMWWRAVPDLEKEQHAVYERMSKNAEDIMGAEHSNWIQNMQDALEELYEEDKLLEEQMVEIIEKFQNDPDGAYFYGEDDYYISAEDLDAKGYVPVGGTVDMVEVLEKGKEIINNMDEPTLASAKKSTVETLLSDSDGDGESDAVELFKNLVSGDNGELSEEIKEAVAEKATEIVEEAMEEALESMLDNNLTVDESTPIDLEPEMLNELFGDLDPDTEIDDLSDLFGDG